MIMSYNSKFPMMDLAMPASPPVISVRVSTIERQLLEDASAQRGVKLSDFVRRQALEAAEMELLERRQVEIPARAWEEIEVFLQSPSKDIPALRELASTKPTWEQ